MSATNRGGEREKNDHYGTPMSVCLKAMRVVPIVSPDVVVLDPGAGTGNWGAATRLLYPDACIDGVELRDSPDPGANSVYELAQASVADLAWPGVTARPLQGPLYDSWQSNTDFLSTSTASLGSTYDLSVGNPPYKLAEEFVRHAMTLVSPDGHIAFLLRLSFLEGRARAAGLWKDYPLKRLHVLSKRPSFTGNSKTDAAAYALFVWQKSHKGPFTGGWL